MNESVINKTYGILKDYAKKNRTIYYSDLYNEIGVDRKSPAERHRGSLILSEVNKRSIKDNDVMITAIVFEQLTQMPGNGFFELAIELGRLNKNSTEAEKNIFFEKEKNKIYEEYNKVESANAITNIRELIEYVLNNFIKDKAEAFTQHPLAQILRDKPKEIITPLLSGENFKVSSSAGQGQWSDVPWIVIFDQNETDGPQEGVYVAILFSSDMERVYLCLGQGVYKTMEKLGRRKAIEYFNAKAFEIRNNFTFDGFEKDGNIHLADAGLGKDYELSTIFYKEYQRDKLPDNGKLEGDLKKIIIYYNNYLNSTNVLTAGTQFEVGSVEEGRKNLKIHYARERNQKIIKEVKNKVLKEKGALECSICQFSFLDHYGERGKNFIEGHHIKPIKEMSEGEVTSVNDIALVCANCHRIIHIKSPWLTMEEIKKIYS